GRSPRRGGSDENGRTEMDRPDWIDPSSACRARLASSGEASVTNPNPRTLPVARSRGKLTSTTLLPVASNSCRKTSSLTDSAKPATKSLRASSVAMLALPCCSRVIGPGRLGRRFGARVFDDNCQSIAVHAPAYHPSRAATAIMFCPSQNSRPRSPSGAARLGVRPGFTPAGCGGSVAPLGRPLRTHRASLRALWVRGVGRAARAPTGFRRPAQRGVCFERGATRPETRIRREIRFGRAPPLPSPLEIQVELARAFCESPRPMRVRVLVNPVAGSGAGTRRLPAILHELERAGASADVAETRA